MTRTLHLIALFLVCCPAAPAGTEPDGLEFIQRPGIQLPLRLPLRDESGQAVRFGDYFGSLPVVLVLGYFDCRNLCGTVLDGVVESLARTDFPASAYRLLAVSVDPREGSATARRKQAAYRGLPGAAGVHFLTGAGDATKLLAERVGFPYAWDAEHDQYMHPAGFVVATPDGRVARYFLGVRFDPRDLRSALAEAAAGRAGSPSDRLLLLCAHYDPRTGRYTVAVMAAVRTACLLLAAALGCWIWRSRRGRAG